MATIQWLTPDAYANAFSAADFNALASSSGILSTATAVANGTTRRLYADLSFITVTSTFTPTAGGHLAFYLLPLLDDGTSYPNNANGATAGTQPAITYFAGAIAFGTTALAHAGMMRGVLIPPGTFKWYVINRTGVALPASATAMTCKYRLYGEESV